MNKHQKSVLIIVIVLVTIFTLFPPWEQTFQDQGISQVVKPAGYHLIFAPPEPQEDSYVFGVRLDLKRYLIQLLGISILFCGFFYLLKEDKSKVKNSNSVA